jgi:hypothetical protein
LLCAAIGPSDHGDSGDHPIPGSLIGPLVPGWLDSGGSSSAPPVARCLSDLPIPRSGVRSLIAGARPGDFGEFFISPSGDPDGFAFPIPAIMAIRGGQVCEKSSRKKVRRKSCVRAIANESNALPKAVAEKCAEPKHTCQGMTLQLAEKCAEQCCTCQGSTSVEP